MDQFASTLKIGDTVKLLSKAARIVMDTSVWQNQVLSSVYFDWQRHHPARLYYVINHISYANTGTLICTLRMAPTSFTSSGGDLEVLTRTEAALIALAIPGDQLVFIAERETPYEALRDLRRTVVQLKELLR